ncbi:thrombospondin-1-like [Littorina saxatilis]|uniref:thrombospondin-1-like n=1 Tax=Littorina saxatilis TaxID=31220 RepID=UPI0038B4343F
MKANTVAFVTSLSMAWILISLPGIDSQTVVEINSTECGDGSYVTSWVGWTTWSGFGACSERCQGDVGERSRERSRTCPVTVEDCDAEHVEVQYYTCSGEDPPVNGGYGEWSIWRYSGSCSVYCGGRGLRHQERQRDCDTPEPSCGGTECAGQDRQLREVQCNRGGCGGLCQSRPRRTVLTFPRLNGFYYVCLRGKIVVNACPETFTRRSFRAVGYFNFWKIRRLCSI